MLGNEDRVGGLCVRRVVNDDSLHQLRRGSKHSLGYGVFHKMIANSEHFSNILNFSFCHDIL